MKWYVLQVLTGQEAETRDILMADGVEALAPAENRMIRSGGVWRQKVYMLFPGYVFVRLDYGADTHRRLLDTKNVIRILSSGAMPSPLTDDEALWVEYLGGGPLEPSVIALDGGQFRVVEGPLAALEDKLIKIDRHRRRAFVLLTIAGREVRLEFSVELQKSAESKRVDSSPQAGIVHKGNKKIGWCYHPNGEARPRRLDGL